MIERSATLYITGRVTRPIAEMMFHKCRALPAGVRFLSINISDLDHTSAAPAMLSQLLKYWGVERGGGRVRAAFPWTAAATAGSAELVLESASEGGGAVLLCATSL